jgi:hypothetical protein
MNEKSQFSMYQYLIGIEEVRTVRRNAEPLHLLSLVHSLAYSIYLDPMGCLEVPLTEYLQLSKGAPNSSLQTVVKEVTNVPLKPRKSEKVSGTLSFKLEFRYF